jgi:hypothetical protein
VTIVALHMKALTAAHITHEACEKIGGIGTVLEGILTSPVYQRHVARSILVGPLFNHLEVKPDQRLGSDSNVLYSSIDGIDALNLGPRLHPIEWAFNVAFVYGRRRFTVEGDAGGGPRTGEAEVLLVDVFNINKDRLAKFKLKLAQVLGIDSLRYEHDWGFEEYVRLAEPAFYALIAMLRPEELPPEGNPCVLFSHEFMGLPTAFKATFDGEQQFRTLFHAHECSTARNLVENHPGHDTRFYNILRQAREQGRYVEDVFGDQSRSFRHALIRQSHVCDGIIAVGDYAARELHFLDPHFDHHQIDLVFNGIPAHAVSWETRQASRAMLADYAQRLIGWRPEVLMTHVTRPVISKGIWRDFAVADRLEARWKAGGDKRRGVLFIVTTAAGVRRPQDVLQMEEEYAWPRAHRKGYPDLVGPELDIHRMVEQFNATHERMQAVLVNQFGWSADRIGSRLPPDMDFGNLRSGTDVEFGLATYEPFGISPLEPLGSGAICVISSVCGCCAFVESAPGGKDTPNVLVADYTRLDRPRTTDELLYLGQAERDVIERRVADEIAAGLDRVLPRDDAGRNRLLQSGQALARHLGWDKVLEQHLIPMMRRVVDQV